MSPKRRIAVILPVLDAMRHLDVLLPALEGQAGLARGDVLAIDSASQDGTAARLRDWGARVVGIARAQFDHGTTRAMAADLVPDADILVYMTQDAVPAHPDAVARLVAAFADPRVGLAYGRQLPRPGAGWIERHARLFNYPDRSDRRTLSDVPRLGVKTCFCSNSFAAYRRSALEEVGSFPANAYFAEDQVVAARMLMQGHVLAYCAQARVYHSHGYGLRAEAARYFDIGVFHRRNPWLTEAFGGAERAGGGFVMSEARFLARHAPWRLPEAALRTVLKYGAYRLGRGSDRLPARLAATLSAQPSRW